MLAGVSSDKPFEIRYDKHLKNGMNNGIEQWKSLKNVEKKSE